MAIGYHTGQCRLGEFVKIEDWVPPPEILIQKIWGGISERVLLMCSQVMLILLVQGPHSS